MCTIYSDGILKLHSDFQFEFTTGGRDGEVTGDHRGEGATEAEAVRDGGLGDGEELAPVPLLAGPAHLPLKLGVRVALAEEFLETHAGTPAIAGAGDDHHLRLRVSLGFGHRVIHVDGELPVYGVPLFWTVEYYQLVFKILHYTGRAMK